METEHFVPVARRKVSDEIFLMLQEKIFLGTLKAGEKLPPERELSRQLGVTRVPLREALKRLQAMNLIEVRHGDGIYVLDYQSNGSFEFLMSVIQSGLPLEQPLVKSILEFRIIVVPELFRLAAKNAKEENIKKLEEIVEKEKQNSSNRNRLMELDFEFHSEIARASGNLFAQLLYNSLRPVYLTLSAQFFQSVPEPEQIPAHAEIILEALKRGDGDTLARNTRYFLELANDFMLTSLSSKP
ncbi:MAG: FadR family transcriptional regulator [Acidobacteria bacterium]|nr:FadR family transcriptional regulator [Acidobacteriota bacterium]